MKPFSNSLSPAHAGELTRKPGERETASTPASTRDSVPRRGNAGRPDEPARQADSKPGDLISVGADRFCEFCRTQLKRKRRAGGTLESNYHFKQRRFCGMTCKMMKHKPKHSAAHPWVRAGRFKVTAGKEVC